MTEPRPAAAPADETDWGGFTIGGMALALPMAALREVAPCADLTPLPVAAPGLAGGLALRGFTLPVLDLGLALGWTAPDAPMPCAVVAHHDGRLLALRAEDVTGVFRAEPGSRTHAANPPGERLPFGGSIRRADTGALVTVLSVEALAALPGIPWIDDPEPERLTLSGDDSTATADAGPALTSLLLLRAGPRAFAIDASFVHSTLSDPVVEPSPISSPLTPGVVRTYGLRVPAADLTALCGLPPLPAHEQRHAVAVRHDRGLVVLLVQQVMEIVRVSPKRLRPTPSFALPRPALVSRVFAGTDVPADQQVSDDVRARQYLVLDGEALLALPEIAGLAGTNTPDDSQRAVAGIDGAEAAATGRAVLTFLAPREMAVPIEQVAEILPEGQRRAPLDPDGVVTSLIVESTRTIPVVRLERLLGNPVGTDGPPPVLVVPAGDAWMGFEVTRLRSIEHAHWEHSMRPLGAEHDGDESRGPRQTLITVGSGTDKRTIPLLDLHALAGQVLAGAA